MTRREEGKGVVGRDEGELPRRGTLVVERVRGWQTRVIDVYLGECEFECGGWWVIRSDIRIRWVGVLCGVCLPSEGDVRVERVVE